MRDLAGLVAPGRRRRRPGGHRVVEEPEADLGVAAVVEAVRAEEDVRVGPVIAGRHRVQQVVLVGQAAGRVLPAPGAGRLLVLGSAAGEDRGVVGAAGGRRLRVERAGRRVVVRRGRALRRRGPRGGRVADPVPVVGRPPWRCR